MDCTFSGFSLFCKSFKGFHWTSAIPLFCIAAISVMDLSNRILSENICQPILLAAVSAIGIFGLVVKAASVSQNLNDKFKSIHPLKHT
jgi:hypothetical protein